MNLYKKILLIMKSEAEKESSEFVTIEHFNKAIELYFSELEGSFDYDYIESLPSKLFSKEMINKHTNIAVETGNTIKSLLETQNEEFNTNFLTYVLKTLKYSKISPKIFENILDSYKTLKFEDYDSKKTEIIEYYFKYIVVLSNKEEEKYFFDIVDKYNPIFNDETFSRLKTKRLVENKLSSFGINEQNMKDRIEDLIVIANNNQDEILNKYFIENYTFSIENITQITNSILKRDILIKNKIINSDNKISDIESFLKYHNNLMEFRELNYYDFIDFLKNKELSYNDLLKLKSAFNIDINNSIFSKFLSETYNKKILYFFP